MKAFVLAISLCVASCSQDSKSEINRQESTVVDVKKEVNADENSEVVLSKDPFAFILEDWKSKFLYPVPIVDFNEDSLTGFFSQSWYQEDGETLIATPVIGELAQKIERIEKLEEWHLSINEGTNFLYSVQHNDGFVGITLIGMNDAWVNEIKYLSFDSTGKKVGEFVLASDGGDGGFYTKGQGRFINDSTYLYSYVETEHNPETLKQDSIEVGTIETTINWLGETKSTLTRSTLSE